MESDNIILYFGIIREYKGFDILLKAVAELKDINFPVDVINVFRPSKETPLIAKQAVEIGAKALWLQYGIQNSETEKIIQAANMSYISNKCIKQEYQRLFLKMSPVFPVLQ